MPRFKFALHQRVNVPGYSDVQGVITRRADSQSRYCLHWTSRAGLGQQGWFSEAELTAANPSLSERLEAVTPAKRGRRRRRNRQ